MKNDKQYEDKPSSVSGESTRVITLVLPEQTLHLLETIDKDMTQAIVKMTRIATRKAFPMGSSFEIVKVAPRKSVFIVGSDTLLKRIPWLRLAEIAPGRNLIVIPSGKSLESLEIAILELIENVPPDAPAEGKLLQEFRKYVGRLRRNKKMDRAEIMMVDTDE